ncbi:MAG: glycosyltransferase family 4 protein [Actinobacteria bacterium]|nr:glycosyltransferase family 4 protein [Actinomycetota bacterium]
MNDLAFVVPAGIDDATRASGGNVYDRRLRDRLGALGWAVVTHEVQGIWPAASREQAPDLRAVPDDSLVLVDGLIERGAPHAIAELGRRTRLALLLHTADGPEPDVLDRTRLVVTTSYWTARRLAETREMAGVRIAVARPGTDRAPLTTPAPDGSRLLCVAAVVPAKGLDRLIGAVTGLVDQSWTLRCVGPLDRDPEFVAELWSGLARDGCAERVEFTGTLTGRDLDVAYSQADLLVLASRGESYGMVIAEALARGLPVLASSLGGTAEALGLTAAGERPGLLVRGGEFGSALRRWLTDAGLREDLRRAAAERRTTLTGWDDTAATVAAALAGYT